MRKQSIELLRIVSIFGIIWFHSMNYGRSIAYAGLIVFIILSIYFALLPSSKPKSLTDRFWRLGIPWGVWFLIYGVLNVILHKPFLSTDNGFAAAVLAGTSLHLWYLPFIFLMIVFSEFLLTVLTSVPVLTVCYFALLAFFIFTPYWRFRSIEMGAPWAQYAHALGGVLFGVIFAQFFAVRRLLVWGMIISILAVAAYFSYAFSGVGLTYLIGISSVVIAVMIKKDIPFSKVISGISECTLGIYLSHVIWVSLIRRIPAVPDFCVPFVVFAASLVTVYLFRSAFPRLSRYIV